MQFIIAQTKQGLRLQVFNCGFQIAIHNSDNRNYLKRVIGNYTARMNDPKHAGHGKEVHVIWA
jgi:hypothetical protein